MRCRYQGPPPHSHSHSHLRPQVPHHLPCRPDDVRCRHRASLSVVVSGKLYPLDLRPHDWWCQKGQRHHQLAAPKTAATSCQNQICGCCSYFLLRTICMPTIWQPARSFQNKVLGSCFFWMRLTSDIYASTFNQTLSFAILIIIINNMIITTIINISIIIIGLLYELYS